MTAVPTATRTALGPQRCTTRPLQYLALAAYVVFLGLHGAAALPEDWTAPLRNRVASSLPGFDGIAVDALAARTVAVIAS